MAVRLIVDGYNLLGSSGECGLARGEDLAFTRERLLEALRRYKRMKGFRITVVFDGSGPRVGPAAPQIHKGIEVVYSRGPEKADEAIVKMVSRSPAGVVVVTSDQEVAGHSARLGASVISAQEFQRRMMAAVTRDLKGYEEDEEPGPRRSTQKKGASRKMKGRQRRDRRRLDRL
jgi:predicted RNA-binding protein with PIN domain